jgi:hypothetical protein
MLTGSGGRLTNRLRFAIVRKGLTPACREAVLPRTAKCHTGAATANTDVAHHFARSYAFALVFDACA